MPKYYEEKEEDGRACGGVREDLRQCLLESPCVLQENKSPRQCLREGHCKGLQLTFFACKRSMKKPLIQQAEQFWSLDFIWNIVNSKVVESGYQDKIQRKEGILKSLEETWEIGVRQYFDWSRG